MSDTSPKVLIDLFRHLLETLTGQQEKLAAIEAKINEREHIILTLLSNQTCIIDEIKRTNTAYEARTSVYLGVANYVKNKWVVFLLGFAAGVGMISTREVIPLLIAGVAQ